MGGWPDPRAETTEDQDRFTIDTRPMEKRAARRRAVAVTVLLSTIGALLALADRVPALPALTLGVAVGITGLASWTIYQMASRRNDGLLILALPLLLVVLQREYSTLRVLGLSMVLIPVVAFLGVFRRRPETEDELLEDEDEDEDEEDDNLDDDSWDDDE